MAPRNARYVTPPWRVKAIRDRKKEILYGPYDCPSCQCNKLKISIDAKTEEVSANCECGFKYTFKYVRSYAPIDYYNELLDKTRNV